MCVRGIIAHFKGRSLYKKGKAKQDGVDYFSVLPTEILRIIFAHLRPKCLFENVLPVCRTFYSIINNKKWWNTRIQNHPLQKQLLDGSSPLRNLDDVWREVDAWSNWNQQKRHVTSNQGHIEAVKLFTKSSSRFCISAKRQSEKNPFIGKVFQVWSLDNREHNDGLLYETAVGHSEPVRSITMRGADQFISGSHRSVKLCNMDNSAVREIAMHRGAFGNVIGDIAYEGQMEILACSYPFDIVSLHDVHNGFQEIGLFTRPPREVLSAVEIRGRHVYLASTDRLVIVDTRNLSTPLKEHIFDKSMAPDHTVAISMNWSDGLLQCCNHRGYVQEFEASTLRHRSSFSICNEEDRAQYYPPMKLVRNRGTLVATTGTAIKAFSLRPRHEHIGTFNQFPGAQYPTGMDARDGNVVVGCSGGSLITWTTDDEN